jgi:hypothetical protein
VAVGVGVWAFFYPRPYGWVVGGAFALPLVALGATLLGRGRFQLLGVENDARALLAVPLFAPGLCATLRAFDFDLLAPSGLVVPALVGGVALAALALAADRAVRRKPAHLLVLVPLLGGQVAGAWTVANCWRDASPPHEHEAEVRGKLVTTGTGAASYLELGPWGSRTEGENVRVPRALYDRVEVGRRVTVEVRAGRLGLPWLRVSLPTR